MPSSSSSSAQAARQRLADQLREMRGEAGLSGVEFARLAGWRDSSKISKVEKGVRPASKADVELWCHLCRASRERREELLAEQRAMAGMWVTYMEANRGRGLKQIQEVVRDDYERVKLFRNYQTKVIPGLLQTEAITAAYLTQARLEQHLAVDDVAEAVAARLDRQRVLNRPDARWLLLIEEDVLWYRPASHHVHAEQLRHLLQVMRRPTVSFGIIPRRADRGGVCPEEAFVLFDDRLVRVELISGYLNLTAPYEISMYAETWDRLWALAVHGVRARALVQEALDDIES